MQAERVQVLVQQAAAGHVEAFVALVQEFAPGLRVVLAAHLDQPAALIPVEAMVWSAVHARLGEWLPDTPFSQWLMQVAIAPVSSHLAQADRRAIEVQDALSHQLIEHCRVALEDGSELQVQELSERFAALPEAMRTLLIRRYRERQRPSALAASLMISEPELATTLAAARAACDWQGVAKAPGPGDRLVPPLIEDWLNGTIDVDSRSLLATNLGRDLERARQFGRQVRVHLALSAALAPFTRDDAVALARQSGKTAGDSARVMMGESARPVSGPRAPASDLRRPAARMTTSNRQVVPVDLDAPRPSAMPWIVGGGVVLVGIFALLVSTMGGKSATVVRAGEPSKPAQVAPPGPSPSVAPVTPAAPAGGGVLRLDPGRPVNQRPTSPMEVAITGPTTSDLLLSDQPLELRASLSHNVGVKAVEFYLADQLLGSVDGAPYRWTWERPAAGNATITVRVIGQQGVMATSAPVTVEFQRSLGTGTLRREWWLGSTGVSIASSLAVEGYPHRPQGSDLVDRFAAPRDTGDNYLQRLRGFIVPPLDGVYTFWIAGDDEAQLHLSDDDTRARLRLIATSPVFEMGTGVEDWERDPHQRSSPIHLRRGQRYYVEVLHKEGSGNDHVEVGWRLPNGALQRPIPGNHLSPDDQVIAPVSAPVVAPPAQPALPPPTGGLVLWDGVQRAGGSGWSASPVVVVDGAGRDGGKGIRLTLAGEITNCGYNWHAWHPDDSGDDLRGYAGISFWMRITGARRPDFVSSTFGASPKQTITHSQEIILTERLAGLTDGNWHQVVIPFDQSESTFNRSRVWEVMFMVKARAPMEAVLDLDDIVAFTAAPPPVQAAVASGTTLVRSIDFVSSGATYVVADARDGELVYIDRDWRLTGLPQRFAAARLIRTRNNDDRATANPHLRFTVGVPVEVHLAFANQATTLPDWMKSWTRTDAVIKLENGPDFRLYSATFPAGQVVLGANEREATGALDNYFVLVLPSAPAPALASMPWKVVRAINLGGEATEIDGVRFLGHRQAEAEGATPAGTHQPGPWLDEIAWTRATNAYGEVKRNRNWSDKPLSIDGKVYPRGLGAHAASEVIYALDGRYSGFTAVVGLDDASEPGEAIFQVWVDGQKAFDSGVLRRGTAKPVAVPLVGRKELRLVVDPNGNNDWDHADWGNAQLLTPGGNDGVLQVQLGRRATSTFTPKPAADVKTRALLGTALVGTKEGLAFRVKAPNGPSRVWIWVAENGAANSRQFDLTVEGVTLPAVGLLPTGAWEKLGPIEVNLVDGHLDIAATVLKGIPQFMGIVVEQQASAAPEKP
jgi:DNA-directed RNA polymerase specialized sigma24 family protein